MKDQKMANKDANRESIPFDDALRKILSAPPSPHIKPKQKQKKKTAK